MFINNNPDNNKQNNSQNDNFYGSYSDNNQENNIKINKKIGFFERIKQKRQMEKEEEFDKNFYNNMQENSDNFNNISLEENTNKEETNNDFYYTNEEPLSSTSFNDDTKIDKQKRNIGLLICLVLLIIGLIWIGITLFRDSNQDNKILTNLTSFGMVEGREYQLKILSTNLKAPKFSASKNDTINLNTTTGYIKALKKGEATIKILNSNNKEQQQVTVYVVNKKINVSDFKVDSEINLKKGEKALVYIILTPENATELNFTYESSDNNIIVVNNGLIEGINKGNAIITVRCNGITKTINVNVK